MAKFNVPKNSTLYKSSVNAAGALIRAIRSEKKIRQLLIAAVAVTAVCAVSGVGYFQIILIVFSWVLSLVCELFNTALEKGLDYACGEECHPLIRDGKDYASACTFVSIVFASALTILFLWDRFYAAQPRF